MRTKSLELPGNKVKELERLKENEKIYKVLLRHYDPIKIDFEIGELNNKIQELVKQRDEIVETRKNVSDAKSTELELSLKNNRIDQFKIITQHGIIAKLIKATKTVKELG